MLVIEGTVEYVDGIEIMCVRVIFIHIIITLAKLETAWICHFLELIISFINMIVMIVIILNVDKIIWYHQIKRNT